MKKLLVLTLLIGLFSCGPSAEERAASEKEIQDFKNSPEYKQYLSKKTVSKEVQEMAEQQVVSGLKKYYSTEKITPIDRDISTYMFDGCEYVGFLHSQGNTNLNYLAHKGNCKFCHKRDSLMMVSILKSIMPGMIREHGNLPGR